MGKFLLCRREGEESVWDGKSKGEGREPRAGMRTRRKAGMIGLSGGIQDGQSQSKKRDNMGQLKGFKSFWS